MSKADSSEKYGRWRDLDPRRHCTVCGKAGLRWDNSTGLCAACFRQLPRVAKASRSTDAKAVLQRFARTMVDRHGLAAGAGLLGLDAATVSAMLDGRFRIAPLAGGADGFALGDPRPPDAPGPCSGPSAEPSPGPAAEPSPGSSAEHASGPSAKHSSGPSAEFEPDDLAPPAPRPRRARQLTGRDLGLPAAHPLAGVRLDPVVLAHILERYRDLTPLPPALAKVIAPWRKAMRVEIAREVPAQRVRRLNRAAARAQLARYVPKPDAPMNPAKVGNAFGTDPRASNLPQHRLPMRVAVGLWGMGLGVERMTAVAQRAKMPVSKSTIYRLLERSKWRFDGAKSTKVADLAHELDRRPS